MGKRELVLIVAFLVAGVVVYQVTAPPPPPGTDVSVGSIFQRIRRQMQGARETSSGESRQTIPVERAAAMVRISIPRPSDVTITGADRDDVVIEMKTSSRGYTQAEAKAAADAATMKSEWNGDTLALTGAWEDHRGPGGYVTQMSISILVPRRLAVNMLPHLGTLTVSDVARFECVSSRGDTRITGVPGDIQLNHNNGALEITGGAALKLTTRNSRGEITKITGSMHVDATAGRLTFSDLSGTAEIEARNANLTFEKIDGVKPPFRYNGVGGELRIEGLRTEARIDGRNTDLDIELGAAAPVTIYNVGAIVVTAPPGGYTLDAAAQEGRISVEESGITPSDGPDAHAEGKVRGGGPALMLRATRGRIEVRKNGGK